MKPRIATIALGFLAAVFLLGVPEAPSVAGHWDGAIELPGQKLEVLVNLAAGGGAWGGTIDIPAQGANGLALTAIKVESSSVTFAISGIPGDPTFFGVLSPDGNAISGEFTQGGQKFPFRLDRSTEQRYPSCRQAQGHSRLAHYLGLEIDSP